MSFSFRPARLEGVGLFIAIAGSSRTGKTYTALRLAKGIAGETGKIAAIDTEGKRMSHYSKEFDFDVYNMPPPFSGNRFLEAARGAQEAGYAVMVIDSFSLEWSGTGGVLAEHARQWADAKYDQKMSDRIWNRVKGPGSDHKLMMDGFLQLTMPVIFCLRGKEIALHLGGGWKVDQDKTFMFEWTVGLTLHPDTPGKPRYDLVDAKKKPLWKVQDQHRPLFPENQLIGEEAGAALQAWRNSADARAAGSSSMGQTKKPTPDEWFANLTDDFLAAETKDDVEALAARYDVGEALMKAPDDFKAKLNAMIRTALDRVRDDVPAFASALAVPGIRSASAASNADGGA